MIPDSVTSIGVHAFSGCTGLTSVVFLNPETEISAWCGIPSHTVILGYPGSTAQSYAEECGNVFILLEGASISLKAPEAVNEPFVSVGGYASPAADIQIYIDGKEALTVQSAATGKWTANLALPNAADGETYTIKAKVSVQDKTAEASADVVYTPEAPATHTHKLVKTAAKAATCTANGNNEYYTCSECEKVFKKNKITETTAAAEIIKATGHKPVSVAAKAATCTETGLTAGSKCSVCGTVLTAQTTVPATGHKWDNGKITAEPTYEKDGVKTFTCTVWKGTKTETVPKLVKTYTPGDVDGDGKISAADARLALRRSVGLEDYKEGSDKFLACDVDFDGKVSAADARLILRASVGLENPKNRKKA